METASVNLLFYVIKATKSKGVSEMKENQDVLESFQWCLSEWEKVQSSRICDSGFKSTVTLKV